MRIVSNLGWLFVVIDLIGATMLVLSRKGGDAATRGLGQGLGTALAALGLVAALLLWVSRTPGRPLLVILGCVLAAAPAALAATVTLSKQGLGLIYPSMRDRGGPMIPSPQYAFPDAAGREAALALVMTDYAKLDTLLRATPAPDLTAHDERGVSLLGIAARTAIADGGVVRELEGLRLLLAAGARPRPDDVGPDESLIELVTRARSEHALTALEMLLDAGLSPNGQMHDGRLVLFNLMLSPQAARVLLAHGVDRTTRDTRGGAEDWSPVTYQADLRRWATALVLLEGGVPRDHGTPAGSVLARVMQNGKSQITDDDRADPAFQSFMAAVRR